MEEKEKKDRISEEEKQRFKEKLDEIKENLMDEYEDLKDEMDDLKRELKEEREEIREDLEDTFEDLKEERDELLDEMNELKNELESLNGITAEHMEDFQRRVEKNKQKVAKIVSKFTEKAKKKLEKAERKAAKRINISVQPEMSEDWKDWAEDMGTSVSELVRKSMEFVKDNIGDLSKLERMGDVFENLGRDIEKKIKASGIENLGKKIKTRVILDTDSEVRKDTIKKRIQGIIKLHRAIPIEKLALALNKSVNDAEKLIYELAGEGLEGTLEEGVFKFTDDIETVITKFNEKIDNM
ncbi:MAG: hypothetical protein WBH31_15575 [Promethearchaeia archaeon]